VLELLVPQEQVLLVPQELVPQEQVPPPLISQT